MIWMPERFRPPKKADDEKWAAIKYLVEHGFLYHLIYEKNGNNPRDSIKVRFPQTLREAKEFVEKYKENPRGDVY